MEPRWTLYCHIHAASGRRYVGLTKKTMLHRWNRHVYHALKRNDGTHFQRAIRKYGKDAFSHEVLEVCHSLEVANLAEECWIELFDTRNPEKGFNLAKGGEHAPHPVRKNPWGDPIFRDAGMRNLEKARLAALTPESRSTQKAACNSPENLERKREALARRFDDSGQRMALALRMKDVALSDESRDRIRDSNRSRKIADATRVKLSAASTGRRLSADHIAKRSASIRALPKKTHCKRGHALSDAWVRSNGERICRHCYRERRSFMEGSH